MSQNIKWILQNIASLSLLVPLVFYLFFQKKNNSKELRVIFFYLIYCVLNEAVGFYFHRIKAASEFNTLFDIFTVVEYCFFSYFFYLIITTKHIKKLLLPVAVAFTAFAIIDHFFIPSSSLTSGLQPVLIISMCIYYFFDQLKQTNTFLITSTNFWIIISFLIYISGTFFLYIMYENTAHDRAFLTLYIIINSSFNILKNILLSIAMLMKSRVPDQNTFPEDTFNADWDNFRTLKNQN